MTFARRQDMQTTINGHEYDLAPEADLRGADLSEADLSEADLSGSDLRGADLSRTNLSRTNLSGANLRRTNLSGAYLRRTNLSRTNLSEADLSEADLRGADLSRAILCGAGLRGANLSGTLGIPTAASWLKQFESDEQGILVYRAQQGSFAPPAHWKFEPHVVLSEVTNPDRCTDCGCGVSFATLDWVRGHHSDQPLWKCRIAWRDLSDVVVPFGTDGKARCARLELLEIMK